MIDIVVSRQKTSCNFYVSPHLSVRGFFKNGNGLLWVKEGDGRGVGFLTGLYGGGQSSGMAAKHEIFPDGNGMSKLGGACYYFQYDNLSLSPPYEVTNHFGLGF